MKKVAIAALTVLGMIGTAQAAGDASAGQAKAATCAACHGMDGNSPANPLWPKLAGQAPGYITSQLVAFKSGQREDATMAPMVAPLSDQDMADLAAYFSGQQRSINAADEEKAAQGQAIYRGGIAAKGVAACMACHGPSGAGNPPAGYPSLYGQHAAYVSKALKDYRSGVRSTDPNAMMRGVVERMSDAEIEAVAEFVSGLH